MIERREDLRFAAKARQPVGIIGKRGQQHLIATSRFSWVSRARYTSPIPPAPSAERISYGPRRAPEDNGMREV